MSLRQSFLNLSITKKLVLINFIVVIAALCITCGSILAVQSTRLQNVIIKEMQTQADVISYNVAAALSFGDPEEAENILASLSKVSTVVEAAVIDADQQLFARYQRTPSKSPDTVQMPSVLLMHGHAQYYVGDRHLHLIQNITIGRDVIGLLYLKVSLDHLYSALNQTLLILALALSASLLLSLVIIYRLQSIISKPILHLSETTKEISENKLYSLRAQKTSNDELGVLIDGFNEMLENIEQRDEMLNAHKIHLEEVVRRRTRDLESSNSELQETVRALREASKTLQISEENKRIAEESAKTKARFLANMSHELRTPMNGVLGMLNLLADSDLEDDQVEYTSLALDSAKVLLATLDEILDITKIEAGKLTIETAPSDLFQVVDEVVGVLGETAFNKGVELAWYCEGEVPQYVFADSHRIKQILYNLVNNAIKFTEVGHVLLKICVLSPPEQVLIGSEAELAFHVIDTGVGIEADAQAHIFESFTQADDSTTRRFGGTGLGLALCKELTDLMGGDIGVQSEPAKGSKFTARIKLGVPTNEDHMEEIKDALDICAPQNYGTTLTDALILEDQSITLKVVSTRLSGLGIRCKSAKSINDFVRMVGSISHPNTLVLIDLSLPDLDPNEIVQNVYEHIPIRDVPLIAMGCLAQRQRLTLLNRKLLDDQWSKPIKHNVIQRSITALASDSTVTSEYYKDSKAQNVRKGGSSAFSSLTSRGGVSSGNKSQRTKVRSKAKGKARAQDQSDTAKYRLLVVEDNPVNQKVILTRLSGFGYQVDTANNGQEALKMLSVNTYKLVFMDCQMPVMDGYEATHCIRKIEKLVSLPIIALTANALPGDREKCLAAGMSDYLVKPVDASSLKEKLNVWVAQSAEDKSAGGCA